MIISRRKNNHGKDRCSYCNGNTDITSHHLRPSVDGEKKEGPEIPLCYTHHILLHINYPNDVIREFFNTPDKVYKALEGLEELMQ